MANKKKDRSSLSRPKRPIGIFDSGLGGLTLVREIRKVLPNESIIYFGDIARLPYGIKSKEQILRFSVQNTLFLLKHKIKALVVACNSSSSAAFSFLKNHFNLPMLDVVRPAAEEAASKTRAGRIGVISTAATLDSRVYEKAIKKARSTAMVFSKACPLFVPLVEEGWLNGNMTHQIIESYLADLKRQKLDTLVLGCTHYPMLKKAIQKVVGRDVRLVDSVKPTVRELAFLLRENGLSYPGSRRGELKIFVSDRPRNFISVGERFLGEKLRSVKVVRSQ